jgi:hypothetical protein
MVEGGDGIGVKVFISWSGEASQQLALAVRSWLPEVIQLAEPWVSSLDIGKGQRWSVEVSQQLDRSSQGILCVTADNQDKPWLNFEAGALAKSLNGSSVRPLLLDVSPSEVRGPLAQFQATRATDADDMLRLVASINELCPRPLSDDRLRRSFDRTWESFANQVNVIVSVDPQSRPPLRTVDDMVAEALEILRELRRAQDAARREPDPRVELLDLLIRQTRQGPEMASMAAIAGADEAHEDSDVSEIDD